MITELKVLFNKEFAHQITICTCCKSNNNLIMIEGSIDTVCSGICAECSRKAMAHEPEWFDKVNYLPQQSSDVSALLTSFSG